MSRDGKGTGGMSRCGMSSFEKGRGCHSNKAIYRLQAGILLATRHDLHTHETCYQTRDMLSDRRHVIRHETYLQRRDMSSDTIHVIKHETCHRHETSHQTRDMTSDTRRI